MPILPCTGYSELVSAGKAKEAGISAFVMKPMVRKELAETVRRVLDMKTVGVWLPTPCCLPSGNLDSP